jgi:hypothetical protein
MYPNPAGGMLANYLKQGLYRDPKIGVTEVLYEDAMTVVRLDG